MEDIFSTVTLILVAAAFLGGFVDAVAGGGGLITIPALLLAGLAPVEALATNKLQSLCGAVTSTWAYARGGHVDVARQRGAALLALAGGALGALMATLVPGDVLTAALPVVLVAIALYFALKPNMGDVDRTARLSPAVITFTAIPLIGFYDGILGPGTGSLFMLAFVALAGYGLLKATAHTRFLNLASNLGSFLIFVAAGVVVWQIGLLMGIAQIAGARLGSAMAMKNGARMIKPLLVTVCIALAARLLLDPENPVRQWLLGG